MPHVPTRGPSRDFSDLWSLRRECTSIDRPVRSQGLLAACGGYARPAMDVPAFCRESRVLIVAGKGGVGKTTICAALARMAAEAGLAVLVVELEGKVGLALAFGDERPLEYEGSVLMERPSRAARSSHAGSHLTTLCSSTWRTTG